MKSSKANLSPSPGWKPTPTGRVGERIFLVLSLLLIYLLGIVPAAVVGIVIANVVFKIGEPAYAVGAVVSVPVWLLLFPVLAVVARRFLRRKVVGTNKELKATGKPVP